jgi:hypothetical protein
MMKDVMIDLETMGNGPNAAIIAIGATEFDTEGLGSEFYKVVELESSVRAGGVMDTSTVLWWMRQSDSARAEFNRPGEHIGVVLAAFTAWLINTDRCIWGNGASFDNVILRSAYGRLGQQAPWKYWNDRCFRTEKSLYPQVPYVKPAAAHNALADAKAQALHLVKLGVL